jgi:hypothetical protein
MYPRTPGHPSIPSHAHIAQPPTSRQHALLHRVRPNHLPSPHRERLRGPTAINTRHADRRPNHYQRRCPHESFVVDLVHLPVEAGSRSSMQRPCTQRARKPHTSACARHLHVRHNRRQRTRHQLHAPDGSSASRPSPRRSSLPREWILELRARTYTSFRRTHTVHPDAGIARVYQCAPPCAPSARARPIRCDTSNIHPKKGRARADGRLTHFSISV